MTALAITALKIAIALGFSIGVIAVTLMVVGSYFNLRPNRGKAPKKNV